MIDKKLIYVILLAIALLFASIILFILKRPVTIPATFKTINIERKFAAGCITEGDTLFPNDGNKCCAGLLRAYNYEIQEDGDCKSVQGKLGHQGICIKCRDGVCGKGENGCNCPQDCKNFKCKGHGEIPHFIVPGDDMGIQCCEGLMHRQQKEVYSDNCKVEFYAWYASICLNCGDGVCDSKYESRCNCPEDCK